MDFLISAEHAELNATLKPFLVFIRQKEEEKYKCQYDRYFGWTAHNVHILNDSFTRGHSLTLLDYFVRLDRQTSFKDAKQT